MQLRELAMLPDGALPLAALKDHLRLGAGFADDEAQDAVLRGWLRAALAAIERRIDKVLIERDFRLILPQWNTGDSQVLPLSPVSALLAVQLYDGQGVVTPLDTTRWGLVQDAHRPRLEGPYLSLPALPKGGRVEITLTAGFGTFAEVPADLQQAVLLLAAQYHDQRHEPGGPQALPFGVSGLLAPWRVVRTFGGRG